MHEVLAATRSTTKVLVASIRTVPEMVALARHGVDCFTMAQAVAEQFFTDPTTPRQLTPSKTPSATPQNESGALRRPRPLLVISRRRR
jgi:transaldolase